MDWKGMEWIGPEGNGFSGPERNGLAGNGGEWIGFTDRIGQERRGE